MRIYRRESFDVAVVGGGSAGVAAAVAAARQGARVALVERYGFLGGAATNAQVLAYCGFYYRRPEPVRAVGGIGAEMLARLSALGMAADPIRSRTDNWIVALEVEPVKAALDGLVAEAGVALHLHARMIEAMHDGARISAIRAVDHQGAFEIAARSFVDASGEADLAAFADVPMAWVATDDAPGQFASYCVRIGGIPQDVEIDRAALKAMPRPDTAPGVSLREDGGIIIRQPGTDIIWWMGIDIRTDGLSSHSLTRAEQQGRRLAWDFVERLGRLPGCEKARLVATGPQVGIRESRRPQARLMVATADALAGRHADDGIARAAWPIEVHKEAGRPTMTPIGGDGYFDVPLRALRAAQIDNLWLAGRTAGAEEGAFGSLRVMGTAFATGQAAGTAAALAVQGTDDAAAVRRALEAANAII